MTATCLPKPLAPLRSFSLPKPPLTGKRSRRLQHKVDSISENKVRLLCTDEWTVFWDTSRIRFLAFNHDDNCDPSEAWSLAPPSSPGLQWLWMVEGKKEIWEVEPPPKALDAGDAFHAPLVISTNTIHDPGPLLTRSPNWEGC